MPLPDATRLGAVHLTVSDLPRSLDYYRDARSASTCSRRADGEASLGAGGRELLVSSRSRARGRPPATPASTTSPSSLPERADLARWLAHAARDRVPLAGLSDHFVSEALYLCDPDGHGIEIYWDRPREVWEGKVGARMTTMPLDVDDLLGELDDPATAPFDGLPGGTAMGHVHLKVASVAETVALLPRRARLRPDGAARRRRPRSSPPAATTTTSARTPGRARAPPPPPTAPRGSCATRRSCCPTRPSATSSARVGGLRDPRATLFSLTA